MNVSVRLAGFGLAAACVLAAMPASAQFFLKSKDLAGSPVMGDEPGIGQPMPGATPAELQAALVWNLRAGLNFAALRCQFEPTVLAVSNYNAILADHKAELRQSFDTLTKYFNRISKTKKEGQGALDQFGTRVYSSFAINSPYNFCPVAHAIGREAIFQPRGTFGKLAQDRMRELRNSLIPWGEQGLTRYVHPVTAMPRLDAICWSKKGEWVTKKCGAQNFPPLGVGIAQR